MTDALALAFLTDSAEETKQLGARLGALLQAGDFVALIGPLGAGKTCFVQGVAHGLGLNADVCSPTFIVMRYHPGSPGLCHVDAYRLRSAEDLDEIGFEEFMHCAVVAVEWAERVRGAWPNETIVVRLEPQDDQRTVTIEGHGERWREIRAELSL